jgi:hypothetical protein
MEGLLVILMLALLSAVSNWLKRRAQPEEPEVWPDESGPGDRPPAYSGSDAPEEFERPVRPKWEEELRRLLEGEPPPRRQEPRTVVPPPPPLRPVIVTTPHPAMAAPPPIVTAATKSGTIHTIGETALALGRTRELQRRAAEELRRARGQIGGRPFQLPGAQRVARSAELQQARSWFRDPQAARQAVIASIILGAPRAMESSGDPPGLALPGK